MQNDSVSSPRSEAMQYLEQAYASQEQSESEKALEECDTAIRIDPSLADAHNLRGVILEELGRRDEAVLAYHEAVRLDPSFQEAKENLQDIEAELREDRFRSLQTEGKGFGVRVVAYIIDSVVYIVTGFAIQFFIGIVLGIALVLSGREFYIDEQSNLCLNLIVSLVLFTLYFIIFEWLYGATLGKLLLGMRVIQEDGKACSLGSAFLRALLRYIDGFFFGLPAYHSMKSPLYQRIGDKKAQTVVVGSKESIIQEPRAWWWFLVAAGLYLTIATVVAILQISMALR